MRIQGEVVVRTAGSASSDRGDFTFAFIVTTLFASQLKESVESEHVRLFSYTIIAAVHRVQYQALQYKAIRVGRQAAGSPWRQPEKRHW
jgi:hypothetical protein